MKDELLKLCLEDVRNKAYYADDVLDEFLYEEKYRIGMSGQVSSNFLSFSLNENQILGRHEIAPFITEINEELVSIEKELKSHYFDGLAESRGHKMLLRLQSISSTSTRQHTGSSVDESDVLGRQEDVNHIKGM
uniref:Uncharacterized protein n=1 Tax=Nelumbo nucifera TaxID=4432 RepID=A0A822YLB4_NELNU|nr:TPA_asm: hypothetical protein HUJ06_011222 [Nelumbo nucifera]